MEATSTDDDNRISELPEFIIHHILSLLHSPVELVRMSVLSNNWSALTASFPILNFDILKYPMSRESFFKYVEYSTSKFCNQNVTSTHTFNLVTSVEEPSELDIIDKCLELILNRGVQVLSITVLCKPSLPVYRLPNLLLSASSLTSLKIYCCGLPSSLLVYKDAVKFNSLKLLLLYNVHLDDEMIKRLTTNCPLLEEFGLFHSHGFKLICVYKHQNLRKVRFKLEHRVESIYIEAPNLQFFYLSHSLIRDAPLLNLASCKKLAIVAYCGFPSPKTTLFPDFLSSFPFIETLILKLPKDCKHLKLSSSSLTGFELHSECDLDEINIETPNLLLFVYKNGSARPARLAVDAPRMECYPKNDVDALWFQKLQRFLHKKNPFKVLKLHISVVLQKFMDVDELNMIQMSPYEVEHIELELETIKDVSVYLDVVHAVLWCCRPRSLTLRSNFSDFDFKTRSQIVKFTYEMLLVQEHEDAGQTNIQIVLSSSSEPKKCFSNLNSLSTASPRDQLTVQTITFIKEQVL